VRRTRVTGRFRSRSVGVVVLVVCVVLAGCSGGPSETTSDSGTDRPASPAASTIDDSGGSADATSEAAGTTRATRATGSAPTTGPGIEGERDTVPSIGASRSALVTRVIDGDTVEVRYRNDTTDTIRLLGVDTPEVSGDVSPDEFEGVPDTEAGRDHLREWATRASAFAREELSGKEVEIVTDPRADRRDRYGRLLAYVVRTGGRNESDGGGENGSFNAALLRDGYARVYESSSVERERYERIETRAQERGIGLWGFDSGGSGGGNSGDGSDGSDGGNGGEADDGGSTGRESGSPGASGLAIARIEADAPGDDNENPNGEYVVVENRGTEPLDLGGFQVTDEAGHTYVVPAGVRLAPGARLILYSGRGVDSESELYWGSSGAIWNNAGDTVTVYDGSGAVVAERSYGSVG